MNYLISRLAEICQENLLEEKWLIAPSLRIGRQWLDCVARSGQPVVNLHLKTLSRLVYDLIASDLVKNHTAIIPPLGGAILLQQLWRRYREEKTPYLGSLSPSLSLFLKLNSTIESLRLADLDSHAIKVGYFESRSKGEDILRLMEEYRAKLRAGNLLDWADVLREALRIVEKESQAIPPNVLFIIPCDLELAVLEKEFVRRLTEKRRIDLSVRAPSASSKSDFVPHTDLDLLRWIESPSDAPPPFRDGSVSIFSAMGEWNEIREIFRRCFFERIPLDAVELLYTDAETYIPQIYETALAIFPAREDGTIPITFADGIPVRYSRPGRLLKIWLYWIRSNYPQSHLVRIVEEDLLLNPDKEMPDPCEADFQQTLRSIPIGFGYDRYEETMQAAIDACAKQLESLDSFYPDEEENPRRKEIGNRLNEMQRMQVWISGFFRLTPKLGADSKEMLAGAVALLEQYSRCETELDFNSRRILIEEMACMQKWIGDGDPFSPIELVDWMAAAPDRLNVLGSGPREGCLHAASIQNGGYSGRTHTFVAGLDDGRFPGGSTQDPFLLDSEREQLSPNLIAASSRLRAKIDSFYRLLGRLQGKLVLSYSAYNLADDREAFPCLAILNGYRIISGDRDGDFSSLKQWALPTVSFAPHSADLCLTEIEIWMASLREQPGCCNSLASVVRRFPHLGWGLSARQARLSDEFTPYDGWVSEAGVDLDPTLPHGAVVSASRFETLGQCPLRFFFRIGLGLEPPDELEIDPDQWLDAKQFGTLMHALFERFLGELIARNEKPNYEKHAARLRELTNELAQRYKEYILPPNENAFERQRRELLQCATIFLRDEEILSQTHTPVLLELAIGVPGSGASASHFSSKPIAIPLPNGAHFKARGIVDRLDRIGEESQQTYAIWDYKSGGTYKYDRADPFRQGRIIQHGFYYELMNQWLHAQISSQASLAQFGYFFPSRKGKGERITWSPNELTEKGNIFQSLCQLISNGIFPPTNKIDDCNYCDYLPICQDAASIVHASDAKLKNPLNVRLQPLKELRNDER